MTPSTTTAITTTTIGDTASANCVCMNTNPNDDY